MSKTHLAMLEDPIISRQIRTKASFLSCEYLTKFSTYQYYLPAFVPLQKLVRIRTDYNGQTELISLFQKTSKLDFFLKIARLLLVLANQLITLFPRLCL